MKIDKEKLQDANDYAAQGQKAGVGAKGVLSGNIEIPEDGYQYTTLDLTKINELAIEAEKDFREIGDLITAFLNSLNSLERDISSMELSYGDENGVHLHIGDNVTIGDGVQYWETGRGEGRHGTVGSEREAGDDFHIDRVAFYVNGQLVANMDETGADVEEYRAKFAKEYGVELTDVEMSFCIGKGEGLAAGWFQEGKDISYDELNSQNREKMQKQSTQIINDVAAELDATIKGIQEEYAKDSQSIESKVTSLNYREHADYVPEDISFWATMGESGINVLAGAVKVPVTAVTGTVDISSNLITLGHGTHLTKYEWEAIEELADIGKEGLREKGAVSMDDYKVLQEVSGAALWAIPVAYAAAPAAAPVAGEYVSIGGEVYVAGSPEAIAAAEAASASSTAAAEAAAFDSIAAESAGTWFTAEGFVAEGAAAEAATAAEAAAVEAAASSTAAELAAFEGLAAESAGTWFTAEGLIAEGAAAEAATSATVAAADTTAFSSWAAAEGASGWMAPGGAYSMGSGSIILGG